MSLDLYLGRLGFTTLRADPDEPMGDPVTASGDVVTPTDAEPRPLQLAIPVDGAALGIPAGERIHRQLRAMLENGSLTIQGLYLAFAVFPDLNGWLVPSSGTLKPSDAGLTFGDYVLELDTFRRGTTRTHRPARRAEVRDRRLSKSPRDFLGRVFGADYAAAAADVVLTLPVGVTDVVGTLHKPLATTAVVGAEGSLAEVAGVAHGDVVSYEQPEANRSLNDVVVRDRQGFASPDDPSFEDNDVGGYVYGADGLTGLAVGAVATAIVDPTSPTGGKVGQVVTTAAATAQGIGIDIWGVIGVPITLPPIWLRSSVGGGGGYNVKAAVIQLFGGFVEQVITNLPSSTAWTQYQFTYTPTATGRHRLYIRKSANAVAATFFVAIPPAWEEVYGPDQPLTQNDVPVLRNGLCRVRIGTTATNHAIVYETWLAGTGWVERAAVELFNDTPAAMSLAPGRAANVVAWTPERGVVRSTWVHADGRRFDVYVSLARGDSGPTIDVYGAAPGAGVARPALRIVPTAAGAVNLVRSSGSVAIVNGTDHGTHAGLEPWAYLLPPGPALPILVALLLEGQSMIGRTDAIAYGSARTGIDIRGIAGATYVGARLGIGAVASATADAQALGRRNLMAVQAVPELVHR